MEPRPPRIVARTAKSGFDRQHVLELIMTIGIVSMSFVLVALMLIRLSGDARSAVHPPKPQSTPEPVSPEHHEIALGRFKMTMTTTDLMRNFATRGDEKTMHVLQFDASVLVQDATSTRPVEHAFKRYESRVRATVDAVTRSASQEELHDPGLDVLRGRIRSKVNRLLGGEVVNEVVVSDFRYFRL